MKWFRRLLRVQRLRRRLRQAEKEVESLREELMAETIRNREREDWFTSASVMGSRNMYGIPARKGPALQPSQPVRQMDPFVAATTPAQRMEFEMYWLPDALATGLNEAEAKQRFLLERVNRPLLNDDYDQ